MYALLGFSATRCERGGSEWPGKLAAFYRARVYEELRKITLSVDTSDAALATLLLLSWQTHDW
jgi:hypothetical protein